MTSLAPRDFRVCCFMYSILSTHILATGIVGVSVHNSITDMMTVCVCNTISMHACVSGVIVHLCVFLCSVFLVLLFFFLCRRGVQQQVLAVLCVFHHNEFPVHTPSSEGNIYSFSDSLVINHNTSSIPLNLLLNKVHVEVVIVKLVYYRHTFPV